MLAKLSSSICHYKSSCHTHVSTYLCEYVQLSDYVLQRGCYLWGHIQGLQWGCLAGGRGTTATTRFPLVKQPWCHIHHTRGMRHYVLWHLVDVQVVVGGVSFASVITCSIIMSVWAGRTLPLMRFVM